MVNNPGSNHLHVKVGHHICTHYHSAVLFIERIHNLLKCIFVGVNIVAVQLYCKFSAFWMMNTSIPASANSKIISLRNQMDQTLVCGKLLYCFKSSVCRVVIDNYQVELEVCFLFKDRCNGILNCFNSVVDRNNYRCFKFKIVFVKLNVLEFRFQKTANVF